MHFYYVCTSFFQAAMIIFYALLGVALSIPVMHLLLFFSSLSLLPHAISNWQISEPKPVTPGKWIDLWQTGGDVKLDAFFEPDGY
jgi:hypothetical protein